MKNKTREGVEDVHALRFVGDYSWSNCVLSFHVIETSHKNKIIGNKQSEELV